MLAVGFPKCVPVLIRDQPYPTDSFPKYLVFPGNLIDTVDQDDLRIKIIDFGEGSLQWSQPCHRLLRSHSFPHHRGTPGPARSITSSGAGGNPQLSLDAA